MTDEVLIGLLFRRAGAQVSAPEPTDLPIIFQPRTTSACARREAAMRTWLTVNEGAEYAGVSKDTIYTACERREMRHARIGGRRSIRLKPEWIDEWLERHTRETRQWGAASGSSQAGA
jgi:excisionase family DNA binding protein